MALALTVALAPNGADNSQRRTIREGTAKLTGTYPATAGGEAINWLTVMNAGGTDVLLNTLTPTAPLWVEFQVGITSGANPQSIPFLQYNYSTGKLQLYGMAAAAGENTLLEEVAESFSYPAGLTGATLYWKAEWANNA